MIGSERGPTSRCLLVEYKRIFRWGYNLQRSRWSLFWVNYICAQRPNHTIGLFPPEMLQGDKGYERTIFDQLKHVMADWNRLKAVRRYFVCSSKHRQTLKM